MKKWRSRVGQLTPLTLALFATGIALPRPGFFFHVHAGGDHVHVHDDDLADAVAPDHHHHDDAFDRHHHTHGKSTGPAEIEAPDPVELGHWHTRNPFHRVVLPALTAPVGTGLIATLLVAGADDILRSVPRFTCARAPPASCLV